MLLLSMRLYTPRSKWNKNTNLTTDDHIFWTTWFTWWEGVFFKHGSKTVVIHFCQQQKWNISWNCNHLQKFVKPIYFRRWFHEIFKEKDLNFTRKTEKFRENNDIDFCALFYFHEKKKGLEHKRLWVLVNFTEK